MAIQFTNDATTFLASNINASATSITVVDASSFPTLGAGDHTLVTLATPTNDTKEIVKCTAIVGNTLTVIRAQEGTTAASFTTADRAQIRITAQLFRDIMLAYSSLNSYHYTATAGQTTFTGADAHSATLAYLPNNIIVMLNGVGMGTADYTATNGSSIVLNVAATVSDEITIVAFTAFGVSDHYKKGETDTLLDAKVDDSQVLTNVPSGALFTDTVYTHPTNHAISVITGLQAALDGKTTETYVNTAVSNLVDSSPATLNTLNELAAALGDDPNYATTTANAIGTKLPLAGGTMTGVLNVESAENSLAYFKSTDANANIRISDSNSSDINQVGIGATGNNLTLIAGGDNRLTITSAGNVGIGVTPQANWHSNYDAVAIGEQAVLFAHADGIGNDSATYLGTNVYENSGAKYLRTDKSSLYRQQSGKHDFYVAPSGTADAAISWTTAMTIDNSGNVGIGTSSPSVPLHINNSGSSACRLYLENTGNTSAGYTQIWSQNNDLAFNAGNSERMRINSAGEVLIGTTTQGRETDLAVVGPYQVSTGAWSQFGIYSNDSYAINKGGTQMFGGQDGTNVRSWFAGIKGAKENSTSGNYAGYLAFYTRPSGSVPVERMRIASTGNVGIGVSPFATNLGRSIDISNGAGMIGSSNSNYLTGNLYYDSAWKYKANASGSIMLLDGNGTIRWFNAPSGTAGATASVTERMRLSSDGKVGINTTSANTRLQVSGNSANQLATYFCVEGTYPVVYYRDTESGQSSFATYCDGGNFYVRSVPYANRNDANPSSSFQTGVYLSSNSGSWGSTSDENLKTNLVPIENGLAKVNTLRSVIGEFIDDAESKRSPFLIAQDVQAVLPEAVETVVQKVTDENGEEGSSSHLGLQYTAVIPLLVAAIKELSAKNDALETQNATFAARLTALEGE